MSQAQTAGRSDFSIINTTHHDYLITGNNQRARKHLEQIIREAGEAARVFAGALQLPKGNTVKVFVEALTREGWVVA